jgi:hypothetical protein
VTVLLLPFDEASALRARQLRMRALSTGCVVRLRSMSRRSPRRLPAPVLADACREHIGEIDINPLLVRPGLHR